MEMIDLEAEEQGVKNGIESLCGVQRERQVPDITFNG